MSVGATTVVPASHESEVRDVIAACLGRLFGWRSPTEIRERLDDAQAVIEALHNAGWRIVDEEVPLG